MKNKTVLVTGASRGIGRAIALACANKGYDLVITCKNSVEKLEDVKKLCTDLGVKCLCFVGDVGIENDVLNMMEHIKYAGLEIDVLINNAGISHIGLITDMEAHQWQEILNTNLSSVFYCSRAVIPSMVHRKEGKIINISSVWGITGASCEVAYSATKGGVNTFTKALARELAPSNIQVNALALGVIDTEMNGLLSPEEKQAIIEEIPLGRMGRPKEVGEYVLSLISATDYLTGQVIQLDGGFI